ncbi:MAG: DUF4250 domain-containing protein [Fusobacteria bacterium]|nr:DUF4250 domain-containing protein [Fusobacteriota bacterium]
MNLVNYKLMDIHILISLINMKLRDEFNSISDLVSYYDISLDEFLIYLNENKYIYNEKNNSLVEI